MIDLYNEIEEYEKKNPVELCRIVVTDSPNLYESSFDNKIDLINDMSDDELMEFIRSTYRTILNNVFGANETSKKYVNIFQNVRFLDIFIKVTESVINNGLAFKYLDSMVVTRINTICYHYITIPNNMKDDNITVRMIRLADIINRGNKPRLLGLGLSNTLASMLLIARYSDINIEICIKRVNFIIITQNPALMSEKMIEEIIRILYNTYYGEFNKVFIYSMFDVTERDEEDESTYWVTEEIEEVDSTLNLVLLNILEQLPQNMIYTILLEYAQTCELSLSKQPKRFSMQTISSDYDRIKYAIDMIFYNTGIVVP